MPIAASAIVREPVVSIVARPHFSEPDHLAVSWIGDASDGERLVEYAARLTAMSQANPAQRTTREFLEQLNATGHDVLLDHANYSLLLEGISRSAVRQLRDIPASLAFAEASMASTETADARFVVPPALLDDAVLESAWLSQIESAMSAYAALTSATMTRYGWVNDKLQRRKIARDAASGVLPESLEVRVVVTGSARAWRAFIARGAHEGAELEVRRLAIAVLRALHNEAAALFGDFEVYQATDRRDAARTRGARG